MINNTFIERLDDLSETKTNITDNIHLRARFDSAVLEEPLVSDKVRFSFFGLPLLLVLRLLVVDLV